MLKRETRAVEWLPWPSHDLQWQTLLFYLAIGASYYTSAHLGLLWEAQTSSPSLFWPYAGISAGAMLAFGRGGRLNLAAIELICIFAANIASGRDVSFSIFQGVCNPLESLFIVGLIDRWVGPKLLFERFSDLVSFVGAAAVAAAAAGGAIPSPFSHDSGSSKSVISVDPSNSSASSLDDKSAATDSSLDNKGTDTTDGTLTTSPDDFGLCTAANASKSSTANSASDNTNPADDKLAHLAGEVARIGDFRTVEA